MKSMMLVGLLMVVGCAGNNAALKARVEAAEAKQAQMHEQIEQLKNDSDSCTQAMGKVHELEVYVQNQADKAWQAVKQKEAEMAPSVKQSASDGIDSIEMVVKEKANQAYDSVKKTIHDHTN